MDARALMQEARDDLSYIGQKLLTLVIPDAAFAVRQLQIAAEIFCDSDDAAGFLSDWLRVLVPQGRQAPLDDAVLDAAARIVDGVFAVPLSPALGATGVYFAEAMDRRMFLRVMRHVEVVEDHHSVDGRRYLLFTRALGVRLGDAMNQRFRRYHVEAMVKVNEVLTRLKEVVVHLDEAEVVLKSWPRPLWKFVPADSEILLDIVNEAKRAIGALFELQRFIFMEHSELSRILARDD